MRLCWVGRCLKLIRMGTLEDQYETMVGNWSPLVGQYEILVGRYIPLVGRMAAQSGH